MLLSTTLVGFVLTLSNYKSKYIRFSVEYWILLILPQSENTREVQGRILLIQQIGYLVGQPSWLATRMEHNEHQNSLILIAENLFSDDIQKESATIIHSSSFY